MRFGNFACSDIYNNSGIYDAQSIDSIDLSLQTISTFCKLGSFWTSIKIAQVGHGGKERDYEMIATRIDVEMALDAILHLTLAEKFFPHDLDLMQMRLQLHIRDIDSEALVYVDVAARLPESGATFFLFQRAKLKLLSARLSAVRARRRYFYCCSSPFDITTSAVNRHLEPLS